MIMIIKLTPKVRTVSVFSRSLDPFYNIVIYYIKLYMGQDFLGIQYIKLEAATTAKLLLIIWVFFLLVFILIPT